MPQIYPIRPLLSSLLAALVLLGGAQAARQRLRSPKPKTESDQQFIQCSTAIALLNQNRGSEALAFLKKHSCSPLALVQETPLSSELTPSTQVLILSLNLEQAAQQAKAQGQTTLAHAYLTQCRTLSLRIHVAAEDDATRQVAHCVSRVAQRVEQSLRP